MEATATASSNGINRNQAHQNVSVGSALSNIIISAPSHKYSPVCILQLFLRLSYAALKVQKGWSDKGIGEVERLHSFSKKAEQQQADAARRQQSGSYGAVSSAAGDSLQPSAVALGKRKQRDSNSHEAASKRSSAARPGEGAHSPYPQMVPGYQGNGPNQSARPNSYEAFWQSTAPSPNGMQPQYPAPSMPIHQLAQMYNAPYGQAPHPIVPSSMSQQYPYPQQYMQMPAQQQQNQYGFPMSQTGAGLPQSNASSDFTLPQAVSPSRKLNRNTLPTSNSATDIFVQATSLAPSSRGLHSAAHLQEMDTSFGSNSPVTLDDLDVSHIKRYVSRVWPDSFLIQGMFGSQPRPSQSALVPPAPQLPPSPRARRKAATKVSTPVPLEDDEDEGAEDEVDEATKRRKRLQVRGRQEDSSGESEYNPDGDE